MSIEPAKKFKILEFTDSLCVLAKVEKPKARKPKGKGKGKNSKGTTPESAVVSQPADPSKFAHMIDLTRPAPTATWLRQMQLGLKVR